MSNSSFRPNFLILGNIKCGTTSLHAYLSQHPQICMSNPKEPHFFEFYYARGVEFYRKESFAHWNGEAIVGDASPAKTLFPWVPQRIKEVSPEVKMVLLFRHPVERAYSHWWMRHCKGEDKAGFEEAIQANFELIQNGRGAENAANEREFLGSPFRTYLEGGHYRVQVERYLDYFPPEQLRLVDFAELTNRTDEVMKRLFRFLGVEEDYAVDTSSVGNPSLGLVGGRLRRWLQMTRLDRLVPDTARQGLMRAFKRLEKTPEMSPATRLRLNDYYTHHEEDMEHLRELRL